MLPPAGTDLPDHVTLPPPPEPPSWAETKLVLAGIGSVMVTPVASALPMLRSVIVYLRLLPGPTGTPASAFEMTSAGDLIDASMRYAPLPCVPPARIPFDGSRSSWSTATVGKLVPSAAHDAPPLLVTKGPTSVAAYSVFGKDGSRIRELTGLSGRLPLMSVQDWPASVVL